MANVLQDLAQLGGAVVIAVVALWLWSNQQGRLVEEIKLGREQNMELIKQMFTKLDKIIEMLQKK